MKRQYITPTKKDNELFYSFVYQTKNTQTQYIGIRITPDYNFNYITVSYDSENCLYDLATGIPLNITSIKAGYEYYFFLPNTIYQNDSITLTMNSMNNNPLSYVYIYEYESKSSTEYLKNTTHSVTTSIKDNELVSTFSYYVNNKKTQYIVLQLKPNYNMNYFTIKIDIEGGTYHLSNNIPLNITNLKSGFAYYFFISSTKFKNNKIDLKMNNMNKQPFSFLDIYEYVNIASNYTKLTSQQITTKIENDELISSFAYSIDNYNTNYIALKIIPDYDINNLTVKIDIEEGLYDLSNGIPLNVTNLKSGNTYNFFFESTIYHIALINLTMKYMNNQPFSYVNIYEYSSKSSSNGNITQSITTSIKNDELISNFTYSIKNDTTKYMVLEIQPTYDIDYIVVKIDEQNCLYQLSNYDLQNIKNVKAGFTYYFIISSTQYESVFFSLTMNNDINTKPFSYVDIDEYSSSNIIPSSILHSINQSITTSTKNDELLSRFVYSVNDAKTKFVGLKIIPNNDLNYLGVQMYVEKQI